VKRRSGNADSTPASPVKPDLLSKVQRFRMDDFYSKPSQCLLELGFVLNDLPSPPQA
jgi:hypothetical protein